MPEHVITKTRSNVFYQEKGIVLKSLVSTSTSLDTVHYSSLFAFKPEPYKVKGAIHSKIESILKERVHFFL